MNIWNKIIKSFNQEKSLTKSDQKTEKWVADKNAVYFHEDLFCQVEFCPSENLFYLQKENNQINDFAEKHKEGIGYSDIYERNENPRKIIDKKIDFKKLDNFLINLKLERIDDVYEGYGSTSWKCENTYVYRKERAEIFVSPEDGIVKYLWISGFRFHDNETVKDELKLILHNIGIEFDLILNDWDLCEVVDLKKSNEVEKYLNEQIG